MAAHDIASTVAHGGSCTCDADLAAPAASGRRRFIAGMAGAAGVAMVPVAGAARPADKDEPVNLAPAAKPSSRHVSGDTSIAALNNGKDPGSSGDIANGMFGTWPATDTQTADYEWDVPITTDRADVYWWVDGQGIGLPRAWHIEYWNGTKFQRTRATAAPGVVRDAYNTVTFDPVTTNRLRLVVEGDGKLSIGALQWRVWSSGPVPLFAPAIVAGVDRSVVTGGATYLRGEATWLRRGPTDPLGWQKASGPGAVTFADPRVETTTATFSAPGDYVLRLAGSASGKTAASTLKVRVQAPPPERRLDVVYTTPYSIDSPLWSARAKQLIVNWIPHCVAYCERTDPADRAGRPGQFRRGGKGPAW